MTSFKGHRTELHPVLGIETDIRARDVIDIVCALPGATPLASCGGSLQCDRHCGGGVHTCDGYIAFRGSDYMFDFLSLRSSQLGGFDVVHPNGRPDIIVVSWPSLPGSSVVEGVLSELFVALIS